MGRQRKDSAKKTAASKQSLAVKRKKSNKQSKKRKTNGKQISKRTAEKQKVLQKQRKSTRRKKRTFVKKKSPFRKKRKRWYLLLWEIFFSICLTGLVLYLLSLFLFVLPKVTDYGMSPALEAGERLWVNKRGIIRRYSLVYFKDPLTEQPTIRRIIGLPEEEIVYQDDVLWVNGEEKTEYFLSATLKEYRKNDWQFTTDFSVEELTGQTAIPANHYLVMGDNRPYTSDSRSYGLIEAGNIIGVVQWRLLPLHKMTNF